MADLKLTKDKYESQIAFLKSELSKERQLVSKLRVGFMITIGNRK